MSKRTIKEMVQIICSEYSVHLIPDSSRAWNGPQIISNLEQQCNVVVTATDASLEVIQKAVDLNADILICHHGLTWTNGNISLPNSDDLESPRTQIAIENNLTIIGLHLPMDAHPTLGNNAVLSDVIGAEISGTWFNTKGTPSPLSEIFIEQRDYSNWPEIIEIEDGRKSMDIGIIAKVKSSTRSELTSRLQESIGSEQTRNEKVRCFPEDRNLESSMVEIVAICTGAAGGAVVDAMALGADVIISGEGPAHAAILAQESGVGLLLGGHHATETVGPRALAEWLKRTSDLNNWEIKTSFISAPIGL
ncbi:MAG TPA: Nif3-like dinuclear metal center hexameric protein [Candidatus Thalassarchaeaceae archaeon]|nr:Nif3-like dinuclear metal center hexameric protein [Candidatus Thalassarchaeaceae archaeon]